MYSMKHGEPVLAGEGDKVEDFIIINATFDHRIDLDGMQALAFGREETLQHLGQIAPFPDASELVQIEAIETDIDLSQAGGFEGSHFFCQQGSIGREAELGRARQGRQLGDQLVQVSAHQGFAAS